MPISVWNSWCSSFSLVIILFQVYKLLWCLYHHSWHLLLTNGKRLSHLLLCPQILSIYMVMFLLLNKKKGPYGYFQDCTKEGPKKSCKSFFFYKLTWLTESSSLMWVYMVYIPHLVTNTLRVSSSTDKISINSPVSLQTLMVTGSTGKFPSLYGTRLCSLYCYTFFGRIRENHPVLKRQTQPLHFVHNQCSN